MGSRFQEWGGWEGSPQDGLRERGTPNPREEERQWPRMPGKSFAQSRAARARLPRGEASLRPRVAPTALRPPDPRTQLLHREQEQRHWGAGPQSRPDTEGTVGVPQYRAGAQLLQEEDREAQGVTNGRHLLSPGQQPASSHGRSLSSLAHNMTLTTFPLDTDDLVLK